jgi:hypothetical protein
MRLVGGRRQPSPRTAGSGQAIRPDAAPPPATAGAELAERRAVAMRRLFPKLSAWRAPPSFDAQLSAAYGELARAADLVDLERRIRRIEQGRGVTGLPRGLAHAGL